MAMMAWINSNSPGVHLGVKSATATLTSDCTSPSSSLKVSDSLKSSTSPSTAPTGSVGSGSQQSSNGRKLAEVVDEVSNSISTADIHARSTYRSSHQDRISEYSVDSVGYMPNPPVFIASVVTAEVSGATPQGSSHGRAPTYSIELEMALRQEATLESQNVPGLSEKPVSRMKKARKLMKKIFMCTGAHFGATAAGRKTMSDASAQTTVSLQLPDAANLSPLRSPPPHPRREFAPPSPHRDIIAPVLVQDTGEHELDCHSDVSPSFGPCNDSECGCGDTDPDWESGMEHAHDERHDVDCFYEHMNPPWADYALWAADESVGRETDGSGFTEIRQRDRDCYMKIDKIGQKVESWMEAQDETKYDALHRWQGIDAVVDRPRYARSIQEDLGARAECEYDCICQWSKEFGSCLYVDNPNRVLDKLKKKFYDGINAVHNFKQFHCFHNPAMSRKGTEDTHWYFQDRYQCYREREEEIGWWAQATANLPPGALWRGRLGRMQRVMEAKRVNLREGFMRGETGVPSVVEETV